VSYLISKDKTRVINDAPVFGIAAYEGSSDGEVWQGHHVGVFGDKKDAKRWLKTGSPKPPVRVYGK
jgi:hypothetical protein